MKQDFLESGELVIGSIIRLVFISIVITIFLCGIEKCISEICGCHKRTQRYYDINILKRELNKRIERRIERSYGFLEENEEDFE